MNIFQKIFGIKNKEDDMALDLFNANFKSATNFENANDYFKAAEFYFKSTESLAKVLNKNIYAQKIREVDLRLKLLFEKIRVDNLQKFQDMIRR